VARPLFSRCPSDVAARFRALELPAGDPDDGSDRLRSADGVSGRDRRHRAPRRPGRPRIDPLLRSLIQRMAMENGLWGAPRIHGELLKLGLIVSERTVSRYLPDRRTRRSQTWRTFFANHIGNLACTSTITSSFAPSHVDVDASFCRAVLVRRYAGGTRPLRGPWLIGLPRINRRLWATVSQSLSFAAAHAHVSHLARTRRGREPSKLALAALHARPLSPKELRLDSSAAHTGILP